MADLPREKPRVSIVIATYARCERLKRCIQAVRTNVQLSHEIIVVAGGAGDGTEAWLAHQADVRLIQEPGMPGKDCRSTVPREGGTAVTRAGATRAYNQGFRSATGTYVMWLNDDAYPLPGGVEAAVHLLEHPDNADVGMVAFYHNLDRRWNRLDSVRRDGVVYSIYNVRGVPYANFGLLRRDLLERLDHLDERYYFCAWDPDLSLKVQRIAGLKVLGCRKSLVYHEELLDDRKREDLAMVDADNRRLLAKWNLPEKCSYPDPAPLYRTMLREHTVA